MSRPEPTPEVAAVARFLRGNNLEQIGRIDEAIAEYEAVIAADFDATGPYDRLISIYADRAEHGEVVRVATAALARIRATPDKLAWFEKIRDAAAEAATAVPPAAPKRMA